jgi:hypothetical protein
VSKQTIGVLLLVFVALAAIASYPWWSKQFLPSKEKASFDLSLSAFTQESVNKLTIKEEEEVTLSKKGDGWEVNNYPASPAQVGDFFQALANSKIDTLISKNPESHETLEVAENSGVLLTITQNESTAEFIIGKSGPVVDSFYARKKDSHEVYLILSAIRNKLTQTVSDWRDKTLVDLSGVEVKKLEMTSSGESLTINKISEEAWQATKAGQQATLDKSTIDRLISSLSSLEASDFLNDGEIAEFKSAGNKTELTIFGPKENLITKILLYEKDENIWWAQGADEEIYYKIPSYKLTNILLTSEQLFSGAD